MFNLNFEQKLLELENIVKKLEDGTLNLDESLDLFEKGVEITKKCQKILDEAEKRISVITKNGEKTAFSEDE